MTRRRNARKARDYKAEYARSKSRAQRAGYKSVKEYQAVRKALGLQRGISPMPRAVLDRMEAGFTDKARSSANRLARVRRANRQWSAKHSRVSRSRFESRFTDEQASDYFSTFVDPPTEGQEFSQQLHDYLFDYDLIDMEDWEQEYA